MYKLYVAANLGDYSVFCSFNNNLNTLSVVCHRVEAVVSEVVLKNSNSIYPQIEPKNTLLMVE
jgi:hypothetical protein